LGKKPTPDFQTGNIYLMEQTLQKTLRDGEMALLGSQSTNAGHATLVVKVKGRLVHVNNQGWEPHGASPLVAHGLGEALVADHP
jgi:hypothetical protein